MPDCDLLIRNATVIDGTGAARQTAEVAIRGDRIAAVGKLGNASAAEEIDAAGLALAPGFIDTHAHDDLALLNTPLMEPKISQGVTCVINGNCGLSIAPLPTPKAPPAPLDLLSPDAADFFPSVAACFAAREARPAALNSAQLVGHTTLRLAHMDDLDRPASEREIAAMRASLETALQEGAIGLSTGTYYPPAAAAPTEEVIALAEALRCHGGIHATHMRDEADGVLDAIEETGRIGRAAGVPCVISHHKCNGLANHGRSVETLALIDRLAETQELGLDAYPYAASSTTLSIDKVKAASRTIVSWSRPHPEHAGRDLDDVAQEMGVSIEAAVAALSPAGGIFFSMAEEDVRRILAHERTMIGSDGLPADPHPHPRLWGAFARVLGHYARDEGLFSLEEAVRKMTALPAARYGLTGRGRVHEGYFADLVLFDPATIADAATYDAPAAPARGIEMVIVNGQPVWRDGAPTGRTPGRVLKNAATHAL
ncbi:MAG TPA: D-aminoacylase [Thermopetrobacter sp.]|nr:D-aminoacylase [Thermopetrobacter sp.]